MSVIVHIDMNSFFASCEVKRNPTLKGKKVIVGGLSNKSIVSAASYEAKREGIYTTMPIYLAKEKCPDGIFLPVDHEYYQQVSDEIFGYLKSIYKVVEMASIDEAYIDMSDVKIVDPNKYFLELQKYIYEKMHMPCSIGVSYNKFLAKMGSDYKKPLGITIIRKKDIPTIIYPIPIENMYGVGKATSARLKELNIKTIGDLVNYKDEVTLRELFGSMYEAVLANAKGSYTEHVIIKNEPVKSIGNSHTLENNTDDYQIIKENIKYLCDEIAMRLKASKLLASSVTLTLKDEKFVSNSKSKQMLTPSDDNDKIFLEALKLLNKFNLKVVRLVGVSVSKLMNVNDYYEQLTLFNKYEKKGETDLLIENLNKMLGKDVFIKAKDIKSSGKH